MTEGEEVTLVVAPPDPSQMPAMAADEADYVIVLASVDPARGVEHVLPWASTAMVFVTAGKVTGTLMTSTTEVVRQAGITIRSAVLVGASPDDESTGTVTGETRYARRLGPPSAAATNG